MSSQVLDTILNAAVSLLRSIIQSKGQLSIEEMTAIVKAIATDEVNKALLVQSFEKLATEANKTPPKVDIENLNIDTHFHNFELQEDGRRVCACGDAM